MSIEIERKFLVKRFPKFLGFGRTIIQGYLSLDKNCTVRVRVVGNQGYLTIKGESTGISRIEYEYEIPISEAKAMLNLCQGSIIEKTRYKILHENLTWELDIFDGDNKGLVVVEVELLSESEVINKPDWVGTEVSDDKKYFNSRLSKTPYKDW
jgi:CYTH domain-containing protein